MGITSRPCQLETDYERVRALLRDSYAINQRLHNWGLDRWDMLRFSSNHAQELAGERHWLADVRLWETESQQLVGVVNPEGPGDVFFQVHPDYRHIEEEMLLWAEAHHRATRPERPLNFFLAEYDRERAALLARHHYHCCGLAGNTRRFSFHQPLPAAPLPAGYRVRTVRLDDPADLASLAAAKVAAFGGTPWTAETVRVLAMAPTFRPDLDLVVEAPDGSVAALTTLWLDADNKMAVFEPVATHPVHQRRGLARAMMVDGLRRLQPLGADTVYVGVGTGVGPNRLYESIGFTHLDRDIHWQKRF